MYEIAQDLLTNQSHPCIAVGNAEREQGAGIKMLTIPTAETILQVQERDWFIVPCWSGRVVQACEVFESARQGYYGAKPGFRHCECYYPIGQKYVYPKKYRTDAPALVEKPVFGSYLFVRFDEAGADWSRITEINHHVMPAIKWYHHEDEETFQAVYEQATICDAKIQELRRLEARGAFNDITPEQKDKVLSKTLRGFPVRIPCGTYVGAKGAVFHEVNGCLARVKLTILGKDIYLSFPVTDIFPDFDKNAY